jgi:spermidine synthase
MRKIAFLCFLLSGAASVSYQMIWLRDAMTYFGVITPVISAVLSVFMLGLTLGTLLAGKITTQASATRTLTLYALAELLIGFLALSVPALFKMGYKILLHSGAGLSTTYLLFSCVIITLTLLPACTLIGMTFPLLMHSLKNRDTQDGNFSFLYYANLLGALLGCLIPLVLIELYGLERSLTIIVIMNLAASALAVYALRSYQHDNTKPVSEPVQVTRVIPFRYILILFSFGFVALGSEVIWVKAFMPIVGPTVYSFAGILAVYLSASALGTGYHRRKNVIGGKRASLSTNAIILLPTAALLPVLGTSLAVIAAPVVYAYLFSFLSIAIICFLFGYLTPGIIDDIGGNNAYLATRAYIYSCIGCIVGPVFSTYILFPLLGIKYSLISYALLLLLVSLILFPRVKLQALKTACVFMIVLVLALKFPNDEDRIRGQGVLYRDQIGYVGAINSGHKQLLINGVGMTTLATTTKSMAHLPMLHHPTAKSALVICFGMGTTVRSLTTWPLEKITAVELSHGVIQSFNYFFADAGRVLADPRVRIVEDDGRRFLNRSREKFDVIIVDPPPPERAAGSGLLFSSEFLAAVKPHLNEGGIFVQFVGLPDPAAYSLFVNVSLNAIKHNFKYVRIYRSVNHMNLGWGLHVMASDTPFPQLSAQEFIRRLPANAQQDFREWEPRKSLLDLAEASLHTVDEKDLLNPQWNDLVLSDDRPYKEFVLLHHLLDYQTRGRTRAGNSSNSTSFASR